MTSWSCVEVNQGLVILPGTLCARNEQEAKNLIGQQDVIYRTCSSCQQIWIETQVGWVKLGWLLISSVCAALPH